MQQKNHTPATVPIRILFTHFSEAEFDQVTAVLKAIKPDSLEIEQVPLHKLTLRYLNKEQFDVICLRVEYPLEITLQFLQSINFPTQTYPFVLFGDNTDFETAVMLMQAGAADYLPFSQITPLSLRRTLKNVAEIFSIKRQTMAAEQALRASEARYRLIFSTLQDVFFQAIQGKVTLVSPSITKHLGYAPDELVGTLFAGLFRNERDFVALSFNLSHLSTVQDFEICLLAKDGTEKFFSLNATVTFDKNNEAIGLAGTMRDVSQRRLMEQKLRGYAVDLHARNIELDSFTQTVAHDLKSPLMPIVANADLLMACYGKEIGEHGCRILQRIIDTGIQLGAVVDEMLLLASLRYPPKLVPLVMEQVVSNSLERVKQIIGEMPAFTLPKTWLPCLGYAPWVEAIWVNYITNAIKYGGTPPFIQLGMTKLDNGFVRYWVTDNGNGIPESQQDSLFLPFNRLNQHKITGNGVGLANVRQIIEKLGGDVGMENHPYGGSCFWFTLPAYEQP